MADKENLDISALVVFLNKIVGFLEKQGQDIKLQLTKNSELEVTIERAVFLELIQKYLLENLKMDLNHLAKLAWNSLWSKPTDLFNNNNFGLKESFLDKLLRPLKQRLTNGFYVYLKEKIRNQEVSIESLILVKALDLASIRQLISTIAELYLLEYFGQLNLSENLHFASGQTKKA